jgi:hypothetical protein
LVEVLAIPVHEATKFSNPLVIKALRAIDARQPEGPQPFTAAKILAGAQERTFPVAVVACAECFYVMQFAWKPIVEKVDAVE